MKTKVIISTVFFILALSFIYVSADVPQRINYQGKLTDPDGALIDSTCQITFSIYNNQGDPSPVWAETLAVDVEYGSFSVLLGSVHPVSTTLFDGTVKYLGIKVGSDSEMTPRKEIVSVGYAFRSAHAQVADSVVGGGGGVNCEDCDDRFVNVQGPDSIVVYSDLAFMGALSAKAVRNTAVTIYGIKSYATNPTGSAVGIRGEGTGYHLGSTYGVTGYAKNTYESIGTGGDTYGGYFSTSDSGTGHHYGLYGVGLGASSSSTYGCYGSAKNTSTGLAYGGHFHTYSDGTGSHTGVYGSANGSTGFSYGVSGYASNSSTGSAYGVYGYSISNNLGAATGGYFRTGGSDGYYTGVLGDGTGSTSNNVYGVRGTAENSSTGTTYGGYFLTTVDGTGAHYGSRSAGIGSSSNPSYGTYGYAWNTSSGDVYGGYFDAEGAGTGTHYGVYTEGSGSSSSSVYGLYSQVENNSSGNVYGGWFQADSSGSGIHYGLRAQGYGNTSTSVYGIRGYGYNSSNGNVYAGYFQASSSGTGNKYGVYAYALPSEGYAGFFNGDVYIDDSLIVMGGKSAAVKVDNGEYRLLYSQESPEVWFEDFGEGQLVNGRVHIELDPLFLETVTISDQHQMKVFVQLTSGEPMNVVINKGTTGFNVLTEDITSSATFDYRVVAKRKGFENIRLNKMGGPTPEEVEAEQAEFEAELEKERAMMAEQKTKIQEEKARREQERIKMVQEHNRQREEQEKVEAEQMTMQDSR